MLDPLNGVRTLYERSLADHGLTSKGVGWKDEPSQIVRFEKLALVLNGERGDAQITVNDLGCGYGAMFHFLAGLHSIRLAEYNGYDISEEMLSAAGANIGDSRARLINSAELVTQADYTFVSGTFNVKLDTSNEAWTQYVMRTLQNIAEYSKKGFAFNLLSTYVDWKESHLFYGDPSFFFDFCKRNFSRYVTLLHDYPLFEWTIIVRKADQHVT